MAHGSVTVASRRPLPAADLTRRRRRRRSWMFRHDLPLYLMLLPALVGLTVFSIFPLYGLIIAFQNYDPLMGFFASPFVGLDNFRLLFGQPEVWSLFRNTLVIAVGKIVAGTLASLVFALLLHEVRLTWFKRTVQSFSYVLHFLSWVIFGGILLQVLSLDGMVNQLLQVVGLPAVSWLGDPAIFPLTMVGTDVWKEFGFGAILLLAALTGIDPTLYEVAAVDGANRWQRMWHVTLPGLVPMLILLCTLSLGAVLDAGFDQILVLYSPIVHATGDILDTYVYRTGLIGLQFSPAAAVGMLKSVVGLVLIATSYVLARRLAGYRIF
jgi:putative aldouronate transport system permease protein